MIGCKIFGQKVYNMFTPILRNPKKEVIKIQVIAMNNLFS